MAQQLNASLFNPFIHQSFTVMLDDTAVLPLELVAVIVAPSRPAQTIMAHGRELTIRPDPFALHFRGPHQPALPQQMYVFQHPQLELTEPIFVVPIGQDASGRLYEAVFN
jgi:hypothetical protein